MKKKIIYLCSCLAILFSACSDEFLTNSPIMGSTEEGYYQSDEQMFNALMAVYNAIQIDNALAHYVPFGEIRSDNAKTGGGNANDQADMQRLEDFTNTDVNYVSAGLWSRSYTGIYRANLLINAEYDSELARLYKAEAKVLRAWFHFDLLRTYGPCFISLETNYPDNFEFIRDTRENVNKQIEKDLLEAIPLLVTKHPDEMVGRLTQASGQAILAKTYMYWADWDNDNKSIFDKAIPLLQEVMKAHYTLSNDYASLFAPQAENNNESIFEIQRSTQSGNYQLGNHWVMFCGPRNLGDHPDVLAGWGLWVPQMNLYDYFLEEDVVRRSTALLTYDDLVTKPNEEGHDVSWETGAYNPEDFEGLEQGKYVNWNQSVYTVVGNLIRNRPGNERLIRYGEIYLLLAECHLRGSTRDEAEAKRLIDDLRVAHVGGGDASKCMSVDELMTAYPDRFPNPLEVLWYERRCELAGEGDRWYDLVRTGRAALVMGALYPDAWDDKDYYIPISQVETGASGGSLTTYPDEPVPTPPVY